MASIGTVNYLSILALILATIYFYRRLHWHRFNQYSDIPHPPVSLFLGNIKLVAEHVLKGDPQRHTDYVFQEISKSLGDPPVFTLDMRPIGPVLCIVNSYEIAEKLSRASKMFPYSLPKAPFIGTYLPIIGKHSILISEGQKWKSTRKLFNPGFAPQYLATLLPRICEKTAIFIQLLDQHARAGDVFDLNDLCVNLTFDIIGTVVLDIDMHAQVPDKTRCHPIVTYCSKLAQTFHTKGNVYLVDPITRLQQLYYGHLMNRAVQASIQKRFIESQRQEYRPQHRSIVALALGSTRGHIIDPVLLQEITDQVKTFLFAGHDTTAIILQWAIYELSRCPVALATLRSELDEIFGADSDPKVVMRAFTTHGEELMSRLTFLGAVIKETLRLYPPASTARMAPGGSGMTIDIGGTSVAIDGLTMYNCHYLIQRDRTVYGETADQWLPERWLTPSDSRSMGSGAAVNEPDMNPAKERVEEENSPGAWRPFERGPRNCIGQELANIEIRVILALVARRYRFSKVGLGELVKDEKSKPVLGRDGRFAVKTGLYNKHQVTAKPVDGMKIQVDFY